MPEDHFGESVATHYDDDVAAWSEPAAVDPVVDVLAALAGGGAALELGIGTGRIALPLRRRGVAVHGIDLSPAMVARLREKPEGRDIPVTLGDFATTAVDGRFQLVYLLFNTIMNLTSQDEQVACFENAARHLEPGGSFVIEVSIPDLQRLPPGETVHAFAVTSSALGFDEYDLARQGLVSHHYRRRGDVFESFSVPFRYVWPSELDLMARLAGLKLSQRWSSWRGEPFTAASRLHVSIWEKTATA